METDNQLQDRQAWQVIVDQNEEIKRLKRSRLFSNIKPVTLAVIFGWLAMPFVFNILVNSILPKPVKETLALVNAWYSDVTLGLKCSSRNASGRK
jgi:hypothetical protein